MIRATRALSFVATGAVILGACGGGSKTPVATPGSVSNRCPDLTKADEIGAFDFAKEYALSRDAADKVKAAALAAMEVNALFDKLDADLGIACAQIAHDLGDKGDWRAGNEACQAAIKAVLDTRDRLGPKATGTLLVRTPVCLAPIGLVTKCASICDSSVPSTKIKAECEKKAGRCDGNCDGVCELKSPVKCDGTCLGTCDGGFKGTCGGRCRGTCDGKPSTGQCQGTCSGTCDKGTSSGECKGNCGGSCKPKAAGICDGLCVGACTVELADAKCAGEFRTPDVSSDCRARCDLEVINKTECSVPQVGFTIAGSQSQQAADAMKAAVDKSFPGLLKILFEVGDKARSRVLNAQAVISGARKGFGEMARSGGKTTAAASEAQLVKCFDDAFKKAEVAAQQAKVGLDTAVGVRDEATK